MLRILPKKSFHPTITTPSHHHILNKVSLHKIISQSSFPDHLLHYKPTKMYTPTILSFLAVAASFTSAVPTKRQDTPYYDVLLDFNLAFGLDPNPIYESSTYLPPPRGP